MYTVKQMLIGLWILWMLVLGAQTWVICKLSGWFFVGSMGWTENGLTLRGVIVALVLMVILDFVEGVYARLAEIWYHHEGSAFEAQLPAEEIGKKLLRRLALSLIVLLGGWLIATMLN